jgi:hypothetical protein
MHGFVELHCQGDHFLPVVARTRIWTWFLYSLLSKKKSMDNIFALRIAERN